MNQTNVPFLSFWLFMAMIFTALPQVKADTGCRSPNTDMIYFKRNGSVNGVPNFDFRSESDRVPASSMYCVNAGANTQNSCYISSYVSGYPSHAYGVLVTFYFQNCPLDDYVWILLLGVGGIGAYVISSSKQNGETDTYFIANN